MLSLLITVLLALPYCYLIVVPEGSVARLKWLDELQFEGICEMPDKYRWNVTEEDTKTTIENCKLDPLFKYFSEPNSLTPSEVKKVLELANKFLATGDAMAGIIEFYFRNVAESKVSLPDLYFLGHVDLELRKYVKKFGFGIKVEKKSITLDGWEVREEKRPMSLEFFKVLAPYSTSIIIRNFAIDDNSFSLFESVIHSGLKRLEFEKCPLIFSSENYFDFQHLTSMTHFKFSGFFHENMFNMFNTIPRDTLTHLDISNIPFDDEHEIHVLIEILKEFEKLKSLNASRNFPFPWSGAKIGGEILEISSLKSLNLSGNLDADSFFLALGNLPELSNLEHLDISDNLFSSQHDKLLIKYFQKFTSLERLNLNCTISIIGQYSLKLF